MRRTAIALVVLGCIAFVSGLWGVVFTQRPVAVVAEIEELVGILDQGGKGPAVQQRLLDLANRQDLANEVRTHLNHHGAKLAAGGQAACRTLLSAMALINRREARRLRGTGSLLAFGLLSTLAAGALFLYAQHLQRKSQEPTEEEILAAAICDADFSVLICDARGRVTSVNGAWCELTRTARADIVGKRVQEVMTQIELDIEDLEQRLQSSGSSQVEVQVQIGNRQLWAELHLFPIRLDKQVTHHALSLHNLSEQKRGAEAHLVASALRTADVGFLILDSSRRVVWANEAWCKMTNLDRPYIIGQHFHVICRALDFDSRRVKDGIDAGNSVIVESSTKVEGRPRSYRWRVSPVRICEGETAYAVSLWRTDEEITVEA